MTPNYHNSLQKIIWSKYLPTGTLKNCRKITAKILNEICVFLNAHLILHNLSHPSPVQRIDGVDWGRTIKICPFSFFSHFFTQTLKVTNQQVARREARASDVVSFKYIDFEGSAGKANAASGYKELGFHLLWFICMKFFFKCGRVVHI